MFKIKKIIKYITPPACVDLYRLIKNKNNYKVINSKTQNKTLNIQENSAHCTKRPCHYHQLFIRSNGDILPCCLIWMREDMIIGHVTDFNIIEKLKNFNAECICPEYHFIKANENDKINISSINLELSLACQAKCVMCCVDSPSFRGVYNYYKDLENIINLLKPKHILVQGGEVLVQKKSIEFISRIKKKHSSINIDLVTNGNVNLKMIDVVEKLFNRVTFSFVGFETETYKKIMELDLQKTIAFVEELNKRKNVLIFLKYLTTPLNFHESNLFLKWALNLEPVRIEFSDADTNIYINRGTTDKYWDKIFERTANDVKSVILSYKSILLEKNINLRISSKNREMFNINKEFLKINCLEKIISYNYG